MRFVWQLVAVVVVGIVGGQGVAAVEGNPWLTLALGVAAAVLALLVYWGVVRVTERRPVTEVGRKGVGAGLIGGTLLGAGLFGAVIGHIAMLGGYEIHGMGSPTGAVGLVGFMAAAAVTEEVLFRGVLFRKVEEWTGTWISLLLNAVLFGLWHLPNPDATALGIIVITIGAAVTIPLAYVVTRSLWLPIGLHFGWNVSASAIFSTEVSGNDTAQGLLETSTSGHVLLTGGSFGPEASLYCAVFFLLASLVFLWIARRRGHLVPRRRADQVAALTTLSQ